MAHAQRRLVVGVDPLARQVWVQRGFREPLTDQRPGLPFRNLFGQVDGTVQPDVAGDESARCGSGRPHPGSGGWDGHGRARIAMDLERGPGRPHRPGRTPSDGTCARAPADGRVAIGPPDLTATDAIGFHVIDDASHVVEPWRPSRTSGSCGGPTPSTTRLHREAGATAALFISFQADPVRQYVPIQRRLAEADLLNLWTTPVGNAVYAVLPGPRPGEHLAQELLD